MRLQWVEFQNILLWLLNYQQRGKDIFEAKTLRTALGLTVGNTQTRLKRLMEFGVINSTSKYGYYKIVNISSEKIREIKRYCLPKGSIHKKYRFKGEFLTLKEIFDKYKPPIPLHRFSERIARGWSIQKAMQPLIPRQGGEE